MEESDTSKTKVSDSAYSTSCNSRSQRSSGSSKSRHSASASSNSSGYGGHASTLGSVTEFTQPAASKRSKDKKKKGSRSTTVLPEPTTDCLGEDEENLHNSSEVPDAQPVDIASDNTGNTAGLGLGPELVFGGCSSPHDNEALQMAAINQTLSFIQKLKSTIEASAVVPDVTEEKNGANCEASALPPVTDKGTRTKEEFTAIISMSDGIVKHTSAGVTDVLGFPRDMWVGRSITDFVQPKDRAAFASHITSGVASPLTQLDKADCGRRTPFFCSLRCYRGLLRSGFGVKDKAVQYRPCQLTLTFREHLSGLALPETNLEEHDSKAGTLGETASSVGRETPHIYLVITITPISSAYTYPEETRSLPKFATRLLASTVLSEVDPECVPFLGFLPQDILGRSILDFYHPEDMPLMKDVYEAVIKEQGVPFLSKPYRFRTQNGGYALLETEWSSFSNPWSRKLEFIIAQHRVLKGPANPDVFSAPPEGDASAQMSEEVLKESKVIQEEIQNMLNEAVSTSAESTKKRILSKRSKVLASFVDSMLEESKKPELRLEVPPEEQSFSERDSVMLGEISPHHEYYDSKSSSETPPSYNQLNYNDNIQRFFESKPKTTRSGKDKDGSPGKNSPGQDSSLGSGDSGSGGGSGELSGSHDSATSSSHNSYQQPLLTEALLTRHNENMEKRLVQRHRELRNKGDKRDKYHKVPQPGPHHGIKRIGSHSWENYSFKGSKHLHVEANGGAGPPVSGGPTALPGQTTAMQALTGDAGAAGVAGTGIRTGTGTSPDAAVSRIATGGVAGGTAITRPRVAGNTAPNVPPLYQNSANSVWPPFSVTVTPLPSSQPPAAGPYSSFPLMAGAAPHMMPMYYMPGMPGMPGPAGPLGGLGTPELPGQPRVPVRNPYLVTAAYLPATPNPHLQLLYQPVPQSLLYSPLSALHPAPTMLPTSLFPPGACLPGEAAQPTQRQPQAQVQVQARGSAQVSQVGQQQQQQEAPQQPQQHQPQQPQHQPQQQQQPQQPSQQLQQPQIPQQQQQQQRGSIIEESGGYHVPYKFQRPPSQATSVKVEPGSAIGSVASASRQALSVSSNKNKSMSPCGDLSHDEDKAMDDSNQCSERLGAPGDEGSYYSSLYSYLCTDNSDESMPSCKERQHEKGCSCWSRQESISSDSNTTLPTRTRPVRSGPPPWMEGVSMTPEVVLHYQLGRRDLADVLSADMSALANVEQPALVNEQLSQLYEDLGLEGGTPPTLALEEGLTSSSCSSTEEWTAPMGFHKMKKKRRSMEYGRLIMIFEENAPLPPPVTTVA